MAKTGLIPIALMLLLTGQTHAGQLLYTPVNPMFGGSPLNGSWLLSQGSAQNQFSRSRTSTPTQLTPSQQFASQLQSQLYASLANQITQAIFGANAQTSGTYTFGGTTVTFQRVGGEIQITINDGTTTTTVNVPASP